MTITTKKGDRGKTDFFGGLRVNKDDIRIESYGVIDELSSFLGFTKSLCKKKDIKHLIESIQKDLFILGMEITTVPSSLNKLKKRVRAKEVRRLEDLIKKLEIKKGESYFCLPGGGLLSSAFDMARSAARRAERRIVTLKRRRIIKSSYIPVYLNRLSDLLFLLARKYEKD